jgi:hypothetical protein
MSGGTGIERRAMSDRRCTAGGDRRHAPSTANDLYRRIEDKRLAIMADRRRCARRGQDLGIAEPTVSELPDELARLRQGDCV